MHLPEGTTLISADNHWEITEDIFYENFPAPLKDKASPVWDDARAILGGNARRLFKLVANKLKGKAD